MSSDKIRNFNFFGRPSFHKPPPSGKVRNFKTTPSTKDVRQMGRGGGFEISDVPGRGEGGWFVKVRTSENF